MAKAEIQFGELGGGGITYATAFQYVAPSAPSVTFSNLNGTPKRVIFVGHRGDGMCFVYTNFNPTTGEVSTTYEWVTRRAVGGTPVAWTSTNTEITISGNSVTKITGNSDSFYWICLYEY